MAQSIKFEQLSRALDAFRRASGRDNLKLDSAYGGWRVSIDYGPGEGEDDLFQTGYVSKPVLYNTIHAGIHAVNFFKSGKN